MVCGVYIPMDVVYKGVWSVKGCGEMVLIVWRVEGCGLGGVRGREGCGLYG